MTDREQIIAAAKEAGICFHTKPPGTREVFCWQSDIERFYAIAFKAGVDATVPKAFTAGSASRDTEIAELKDALGYDWDKYKAAQDSLREYMLLVRDKDAEVAELVAALERLARLGNGDQYGNSEGNRIAQAALAKWRKGHE